MKPTAKTIMFLGTGSDVGKSIAVAAFCRILKRRGVRVAPFKAQNMSNNSYITVEGGEIGRAQVVQAEAAGLLPSVHMNPVLLKPSSGLGSQVVVQGKVLGRMEAAEYHRYKKHLTTRVMESFDYLASRYEAVVLEGAGSAVEVNLKKGDLVNFAMARRADAPVVLVADIDRGGVFAQVIGSMVLMSRTEKARTAGFVINKFRGDPALFEDGLEIIRKKTGRPVFGLVPWFEDIHLDAEDSVAVQPDRRPIATPRKDRVNVAVIRLPGLSNFTDLEVLDREPDAVVNFLYRSEPLGEYDLLILPGTKNVVEDAVWLKKTGWARHIRSFAQSGGRIIGLCGGYQLLGRDILDPLGVESDRGHVDGLGLMPLATTLMGDKILRRVTGTELVSLLPIRGYEIHMGRTELLDEANPEEIQALIRLREPGRTGDWLDGHALANGRIRGTYVHGFLDAPGLRLALLNQIREEKGLSARKKSAPGHGGRFHQYDRLADHFERYMDVDAMIRVMDR
jgi:adenosylcobyric acid synthase